MKSKTFFTFFILIVFSCQSFGQRCGSFLAFRIYDKPENKLSPLTADTTFLSIVKKDSLLTGEKPVENKVLYGNIKLKVCEIKGSLNSKEIDLFRDINKGLLLKFQTGCGIDYIKISVESANKKMVLYFKSIPSDIDFVIDSIPFTEGKKMYDIQKIIDSKKIIPNQGSPYKTVWGYIILPKEF
jgi:hypothetical protein